MENEATQLIYSDRSRQEIDLQHCARHRFWEFHAFGFGITRKETVVERDTGIYVHEVIKHILKVVQLGDGTMLLPLTETARQQIRMFIQQELAQYKKDAQASGYRNEPEAETERLIAEQSCLIEGMVWAWVKIALPAMLQEFDIVCVEEEEAVILECSCQEDQVGPTQEMIDRHLAKGCSGILQQSRPDVVLRRKADGLLGYHDWKTEKYLSDWSVNKYRNSVQFAVGTIGVERRLEEPVTHYYVRVLVRGDRKASYIPEIKKFEGPKCQLSHLCYVGLGNPPLTDEFDTTIQWYKKLPVWEMHMEGKPQGWSNSEYLVEMLRTTTLAEMFGVIGPYDRQEHLIASYLRQLPPYEREWVRRVWAVHARVARGEKVDHALDQEVPASWDCYKYGSPCAFYEICHKDGVSAEDPLASGIFKLREPHHEAEAAYAAKVRSQSK